MLQQTDNPGQGNRGGQEYGEGNYHQSQRNQDSQRHQTTSDEEQIKKENKKDSIPSDKKEQDKFSPGEAEEYNPDDFATD